VIESRPPEDCGPDLALRGMRMGSRKGVSKDRVIARRRSRPGRRLIPILAAVLIGLPGTARAEPPAAGRLQILEDPAFVNGISADGGVIVGTNDATQRCFRVCIPIDILPKLTALAWSGGAARPVVLPPVGGDSTLASSANGISADGSTIAGFSERRGAPVRDAFGNVIGRPVERRATAWFDGGATPVDLGRDGWTQSAARHVSGDGGVIGGSSVADGDPLGRERATAWFDGGQTAVLLPLPLGPERSGNSTVTGISRDGQVLIGAESDLIFNVGRAMVWTGRGTVVRYLVAEGAARAVAISDRGEVIGGSAAQGELGPRGPFRYRPVAWFDGSDTATALGPSTAGEGWVNDVSGDGRVIVGSRTAGDGVERAVAWRDRGRRETELATPAAGTSEARAVSGDGQVIVGQGGGEAMVWWTPEAMGMSLGVNAAAPQGLGFGRSVATDVSADGRVIIGQYDSFALPFGGFTRAFIYTRAAGMQDYGNLIASFALANDTAVAAAQTQQAVSALLAPGCRVAPGRKTCLSVAGSLSGSGSDTALGLGSQSLNGVTLSAGHRAGETATIGLTLALGTAEQSGSAFDADASRGIALWARWEERPGTGLGWQASAGAGWSGAGQRITRGAGLPLVSPASGEADLSGSGVTAGVGYGLAAGGGLTLGPAVGLTWIGTTRAAYSETGGGFTGSYAAMDQDVTFATLGFGGAQLLDGGLALALDAGFEVDLDAPDVTVAGTTTVPGLPSFSDTASLRRNDLRPYLSATVTRALDDRSVLQVGASLATPIYSDAPEWGGSIGYTISF